MKPEDKQLLLKDLSARLPYGVVVNYNGLAQPLFGIEPTQHFQIILDNALDGEHNGLVYISLDVDGEEPKPYLRPMDSMTEGEIEELLNIDKKRGIYSSRHLTWHLDGEITDYLNKNMFDWRGLIPMGLALEAPEGMYN